MTVQWGDTGKIAYGPLKSYTLSFATPRETLLGSPVSLPSANPGTPQVTMTIQTTDLPTITPSPLSVTYCAVLYIAGKNTDAASQSVSYQVYKNGTAISGASGSATVATNTYWTHEHFRFNSIAVGDVLGVSVWSASANVNYDYYAMCVYPTRPVLGKCYLNKDVNFGTFTYPTLSSGNPSVSLSQTPVIYPTSSSQNMQINANTTFGALSWSSTYNAFVTNYGDNNVTSITETNATYRPYYRRNALPSTITFREILR